MEQFSIDFCHHDTKYNFEKVRVNELGTDIK